MNKDSIGVDISKDNLDVHRLSSGVSRRFPNTQQGHQAFIVWVGSSLDCVVFEPTGAYHRAFESALAAAHLPMIKVNPRQARRFADALGVLAKTDQLDAVLLAKMGSVLDLALYQAPSEKIIFLKQLQTARDALISDRTAAKNRQKILELPLLRQQNEDRLTQIAAQLEEIEAEIHRLIQDDPLLKRRFEILTSIPGVGDLTAFVLLAEMPELGQLDGKQVAALAGLAPMVRQSGRWTGRACLRGGRSRVRRGLYMAALSASRFNQDLKAKYQAFKKAGKPFKVALSALMRKLIVLANCLLSQDRFWEKKAPRTA